MRRAGSGRRMSADVMRAADGPKYGASILAYSCLFCQNFAVIMPRPAAQIGYSGITMWSPLADPSRMMRYVM